MLTYIFVDSCTKQTNKKNKYGESVAAWGVCRDDNELFRCGIHYFKYEGPNITFYQGIIRALEQCLEACWNDKVIVGGDCIPVIEQLNGKRVVNKMSKQYNQVKALIRKYNKKNNSIKFEYINENNCVYKEIDQLAKRGINFIKNIIKKS